MNQYRYFPLALFVAVSGYFLVVHPILQYTNSIASRDLPGAFFFTKLVFYPEPWEIPVYLLGIFLIPLIAFLVNKLFSYLTGQFKRVKQILDHWPLIVSLLIFTVVACKVLTHVFWFEYWKNLELKGDLKVQLLVLIALGIFMIIYWRRYDFFSISEMIESLPWEKWKYIVFALLTFVIFTPNFTFDHFHYNFFLSTVNDLHHGKHLLYDTLNQYGIGQTYLLNFLLSFFPVLSYQTLHVVFFALIIAFYIWWYWFLRKFLHSAFWATAGLVSTIVLFVIPWSDLNFTFMAPGNGPYRHLAIILIFSSWIYYLKKFTKSGYYLIIFTSASGFYWFVDNGIFLVITSFVGLTYLWPRRFWRFGLDLAVATAMLGVTYSLGNYLVLGSWPKWTLLYETARLFQQGFLLYPLPVYGFFLIYIFVYLGTILYALRQRYCQEKGKFVLPLLLGVYGLCQLTYYVSRSYTENLASRNGFLLIALVLWWVKEIDVFSSARSSRVIVSGFVTASVVFVTVFGGYDLLTTFATREYVNIKENFQHERLWDKAIFGGYGEVVQDIAYLQKHYHTLERIPLLHWHDVKILLDLNKANLFGPYDFDLLYLHKQMDQFIEQAHMVRPEVIFIGRADIPGFTPFALGEDKLEYFRTGISDIYHVEKLLETMEIWKLK